jgi:uncharacterized protein YqiB (DUF1249 family)
MIATDSMCAVSWRARPVSFVSLMTLYESNYIRLRGLVREPAELCGEQVSRVASDCDLHLAVIERSRYTSVLRLTYLFEDAGGLVAEPDLELRVYHDARLLEACRCARRQRHAGLAALQSGLSSALGERWRRNMLLNKWLDYCTDRGHRFAQAASAAAGREDGVAAAHARD